MITENVPVPTSYRRLQEKKYLGYPYRLLAVWAITFSVCMFFIYVLVKCGVSNLFVFVLPLVGVGIVFTKYFSNVAKLDQTINHIRLGIRVIRGTNITKKYVESIEDLKKIVPIEYITDAGMIRYTNEMSAILVLLDPPRVSDDDLDSHNKKMLNVVNSLYGQFSFQFVALSSANTQNAVETISREAMKKTDQPKEVTDHLFSIYKESHDESTQVVEWTFVLVVTIPETKSIEEAEKLKTAFMSGLSKELRRTGIMAKEVDDHNEVVRLIRTMITATGQLF